MNTKIKLAYEIDDGGRKSAGYKGTCDDCVTRAIAIAAEQSYRQVYDEIKERMQYWDYRKLFNPLVSGRDKSPRDGVHKRIYEDYLYDLGWRWTPTMKIGSGCKVHLRADELPQGRIIAQVSKHLVAVIDGVIHDLSDCSRNGTRCVYGYWTKDIR